jgi:hypothetical protein
MLYSVDCEKIGPSETNLNDDELIYLNLFIFLFI